MCEEKPDQNKCGLQGPDDLMIRNLRKPASNQVCEMKRIVSALLFVNCAKPTLFLTLLLMY